jgi:glyoxylase-like metal-dependent hydrolase (beta-lactamase superfamily II)
MTRQISKSLYRLDLGITKCYLVGCSDGYLLIDTGYPKDHERFLKITDRLDLEQDKIQYLLLTHHHDDHAGFAARLVEQTGCKVIVHQDAILPLRKGESEETMEPLNHCIRVVFSLFRIIHREFRYPPFAIRDNDLVVSDDDFDLLRSIGIEGKILHTPGHSRDSISVVLSDGNAIVGDAAMNFLNFCGTKYRPIFVEDIGLVFESWQKLIDHGAEWIYPSHGSPFSAEKLTRYGKKARKNNIIKCPHSYQNRKE